MIPLFQGGVLKKKKTIVRSEKLGRLLLQGKVLILFGAKMFKLEEYPCNRKSEPVAGSIRGWNASKIRGKGSEMIA